MAEAGLSLPFTQSIEEHGLKPVATLDAFITLIPLY
jgi:hypothetical protein